MLAGEIKWENRRVYELLGELAGMVRELTYYVSPQARPLYPDREDEPTL